jgi:hypothetical protein
MKGLQSKFMKKIIIILISLFPLISMAKNFELGVVVGAPTGISGKVDLGNNRSIDGVIAYSLSDDYGMELHADYLVENAHTFNLKDLNPLNVYYGIGARLIDIRRGKDHGELAFGPRAPLGISIDMNQPTVKFFAELALAFDIVPSTNLDLEGGIGLRYRF